MISVAMYFSGIMRVACCVLRVAQPILRSEEG